MVSGRGITKEMDCAWNYRSCQRNDGRDRPCKFVFSILVGVLMKSHKCHQLSTDGRRVTFHWDMYRRSKLLQQKPEFLNEITRS